MILYHYTSGQHLRGIARYGLTVGDVPTNIRRQRGRVGVWFTSAMTAGGHGLEGASVDKTRYRLAVEVPDASPLLARWSEWAPKHVTPETIDILHKAAAEHQGEGPETWLIFFGVIQPSAIVSCVDMKTGEEIADWGETSPPELDIRAVPPWRRETWHKQLIKRIEKTLAAHARG